MKSRAGGGNCWYIAEALEYSVDYLEKLNKYTIRPAENTHGHEVRIFFYLDILEFTFHRWKPLLLPTLIATRHLGEAERNKNKKSDSSLSLVIRVRKDEEAFEKAF